MFLLVARDAALAAVKDPLKDAHVLAKTGPEVFAVGAFAEPVHMEDAREVGEEAAHFDPVVEVMPHVIAAEGEHGHGVAPDPADRAGGGGGGLAAHGGAHVDAVDPIEGLVDERHGGGAAAAEDDRADGDAVGVVPVGVDAGALAGGGGEAAIGVGR